MAEKIVLTLLIMLFLLFAYWQYNGAINADFVFKQQQQQKSNLRQEAQKAINNTYKKGYDPTTKNVPV